MALVLWSLMWSVHSTICGDRANKCWTGMSIRWGWASPKKRMDIIIAIQVTCKIADLDDVVSTSDRHGWRLFRQDTIYRPAPQRHNLLGEKHGRPMLKAKAALGILWWSHFAYRASLRQKKGGGRGGDKRRWTQSRAREIVDFNKVLFFCESDKCFPRESCMCNLSLQGEEQIQKFRRLTLMQSKTTSVPVGAWSTMNWALFLRRSESSNWPWDEAVSGARGGGSGRFLIRVLQISHVLLPYKRRQFVISKPWQ